MTKKCITCQVVKNIEEFNIVKTRNNQIQSKCKKCCNKYACERNRIKIKIVGTYNWYYRRFYRIKKSAIRRKLKFELSFEEWKELYDTKDCFYCLEPTTFKSIDRVNNNLGYSVENCVMACHECNSLKSNYSKEEVIKLIKIYKKILTTF